MKIAYEDWNASETSLYKVYLANKIIDEYADLGYTLTLRQLYYQFVSRGWLVNTQKEYNNLGKCMTRARLAGMVDWEAIEDRNRTHNTFLIQESDQAVIDQLPRRIQFDRWDRQPEYIEVWVEKDALVNVVEKACNPYMVPYMACKGYLSASEAWRAGRRFTRAWNAGKHCTLIHLGDHDPSGIDMTRDNQDRLNLFAGQYNVEVHRIALNMDQVEEYQPPPNPAKETDSRSKAYTTKYGHTSWELDALDPSTLEQLILDEICGHIDFHLWEHVETEEEEVRARLESLGRHWDDVKHFLREIE